MVDIEKLVQWDNECKDSFALWHQRMDADFDLWNMSRQVFDKHKEAVNITSNLARALCDDAQDKLVGSAMQIRARAPVDADDKIKQLAEDVETLLNFSFYKADERLEDLIEGPLKPIVSWHGLVRGIIPVRVLVEETDDGVEFNYTPLDGRYFTFSVGSKGLQRTCYTTYRTRESVEEEYNVSLGKSKEVEVLDFWVMDDGKIYNAVVTKNKEVLKDATEIEWLRRIPIVIAPVVKSPKISQESQGIRYDKFGESVMAPNRQTYQQGDQLLSIAATNAKMKAYEPLVHMNPPPGQGDPIYLGPEDRTGPGAIVNLPYGHQFGPLNTPEVPQSLWNIIGEIKNQQRSAVYPEYDYSDWSTPPSGTALGILREGRRKVIGPALHALGRVYTQIARMTLEQLRDQKIKTKVKMLQEEQYFSKVVPHSTVGKDFYVDVRFNSTAPYEQVENAQLAEMLVRQGLVSTDYARREIMQVPDAESQAVEVELERAKQIAPAYALQKAGQKAILAGKEEEARMLMEQSLLMRQQQQTQGQGGQQNA